MNRRRRRTLVRIKRICILILILLVVGVGIFFGAKKVISLLNSDDNKTDVITKKEEDIDYIGTVVIDAGHGGTDPGCSNGDILEKDITLKYAKAIGQLLEEDHVKVIYTREDDSNLEMDTYKTDANGTTATTDLRARAELGEQYKADLFVSIHVDASTDGSGKGHTIYCHSGLEDSVDLATFIDKRLTPIAALNTNGVKDGSGLRVLRLNTTISCLIELGFIKNDLQYLTSDAGLAELASAIEDGIVDKLEAGKINPNLKLEKQPDLY